MELETEALCSAGHGERSADRRHQRNGYRDRNWEMGFTVELAKGAVLAIRVGKNNRTGLLPVPKTPS